jgi:hypothetical protein
MTGATKMLTTVTPAKVTLPLFLSNALDAARGDLIVALRTQPAILDVIICNLIVKRAVGVPGSTFESWDLVKRRLGAPFV